MTEKESILVELLACQDAVFFPIRRFGGNYPAVACERRAMFHAGGLLWHPRDKTEAGRKAAQRACDALAADGLLKRTRMKAVRDLATKLTFQGEAYARALIGEIDTFDSVPEFLALVASFDGHPETSRDSELVPETLLANDGKGGKWGESSSEVWAEVTRRAYSALCRNLVKSDASTRGHCWYSLTKQGRKMALDPSLWPEVTIDLPDSDEDAWQHYEATWTAELAALRSATPILPGEIGQIPVPLSMPLRGKGA